MNGDVKAKDILEKWVRLAIFHGNGNQSQVAELLGVSNSRLSNWVRGVSLPDVEWLIRTWVHGREQWVQVMAFQVLQVVLPEVFVDADLCSLMKEMKRFEETADGMVVAGSPVEVPWS